MLLESGKGYVSFRDHKQHLKLIVPPQKPMAQRLFPGVQCAFVPEA